ncbi:MAG: hydrogenase formation protein HypD [Tannerellaceae bacterium]|jgi:hydrogenase expression/formation protein HypD|nr:hydrogenase formation protein HypD [Tannerellaceae bacterium]
MKYIDEYRSREYAGMLSRAIRRTATQPWRIMEICGGQTHAIARYRLEEMLPPGIRLLHGPGCPVCVTPERLVDGAIRLAAQPGVLLATFGDMMRVPGSRSDLFRAKARGADVRMLYSPLDAVHLAATHPEKEVVFFAIGFETTLPVHLTALKEAIRRGLANFSLLTSFFLVPPAMEAILSDPDCRVDGFLAAGHVCSVTGTAAYEPLAERYRKPVVVAGFEPVDLLYGLHRCICRLEAGEYGVENAYTRAVPEGGNPRFQALMDEMLEPCEGDWRGIGHIAASSLRLRPAYGAYDACRRFAFLTEEGATDADTEETPRSAAAGCLAGEIMRGRKQPSDCPHFGKGCSPDHPIGAPMVSAEGVCAGYFHTES